MLEARYFEWVSEGVVGKVWEDARGVEESVFVAVASGWETWKRSGSKVACVVVREGVLVTSIGSETGKRNSSSIVCAVVETIDHALVFPRCVGMCTAGIRGERSIEIAIGNKYRKSTTVRFADKQSGAVVGDMANSCERKLMGIINEVKAVG